MTETRFGLAGTTGPEVIRRTADGSTHIVQSVDLHSDRSAAVTAMSEAEFRAAPFVLVVGAPRTGTSLAMELIEAAGYSLGVVMRSENPRDGHGELIPTTMNPLTVPDDDVPVKERAGKQFGYLHARGANAQKLLMVPEEWLPWYRLCFSDLRIVVTLRDMEAALLSNIDYVYHLENHPVPEVDYEARVMASVRVCVQKFRLMRALLQHDDYHTFELQYEHMMARDRKTLGDLCAFLDTPGQEDAMAACIRPSVSKFSGMSADGE